MNPLAWLKRLHPARMLLPHEYLLGRSTYPPGTDCFPVGTIMGQTGYSADERTGQVIPSGAYRITRRPNCPKGFQAGFGTFGFPIYGVRIGEYSEKMYLRGWVTEDEYRTLLSER